MALQYYIRFNNTVDVNGMRELLSGLIPQRLRIRGTYEYPVWDNGSILIGLTEDQVFRVKFAVDIRDIVNMGIMHRVEVCNVSTDPNRVYEEL